MVKRILAISFAFLMVITFFTACGNGAPTDTSAPANGGGDGTSTGDSGSSGDTTAPGNDGSGVNIVWWAMWNDTEGHAGVLTDAAKRYEADTGNTVEVVFNGREIRRTAYPAIAAGQVIDIIEYDPRHTIMNMQEVLLPLDEYVHKPYDILNGQTVYERCAPVWWDIISTASDDGKIYGTPSSAALFAVFYNKAHFREAGITSVPNNWAEFLVVCEKLLDAGYIPFTNDDAYMMLWYDSYLHSAKGDEWVGLAAHDTTGEYWKDPAVLQMAESFAYMRSKDFIPATAASNISPAGQQAMGLGEVSMFVNGTWFPNELRDLTGPDFEWGTFAWPSVENWTEPNTVHWIGSQGYTLNKDTQVADEAFELLAYFNSDQTEQELADKCFQPPVVTNIETPAMLTDAVGLIANATGFWENFFDDNAELGPILRANFTMLIGGTLTPEQFVDEMVKASQGG